MTAPDEKQTETKFKQWVNEVMDAREKAAFDKSEEERKAKEKADAEKPKPFSLISSLFGE